MKDDAMKRRAWAAEDAPAEDPRVLLVIGGGIAAYKTPELIRVLRARGFAVRTILTRAGAEFVTPLTLATLSGQPVGRELLSLDEESEIGHIQLVRQADCILVAPATADLLARMAAGRADDLATACLLAAYRPPLVAPAMNPAMWRHDATQENVRRLAARGVRFLGPEHGDTACGEIGPGRMCEPETLAEAVAAQLDRRRRLAGLRALVTAGPTREPMDAVRFLSNASSGKQGYAVAEALAEAGAAVRLVSGPVALETPHQVERVSVVTAREMLEAALQAPYSDVAVCAAAVSDWRPRRAQDGKPPKGEKALSLALAPNPDILATLASGAADVAPGFRRPRLVVGFAAEAGPPEERRARAQAKRRDKGCDWILLNDVGPEAGIVGGEENQITLISEDGTQEWPRASKRVVAGLLIDRIAAHFSARGRA